MGFPSQPRVLVTGAAGGLGRAIAEALANREARLLVTDVRIEGLETTAERVEQRGGEAKTFELDVTKPEAWAAAAEIVNEAWGGLDILVNNAGVAAVGRVGEVPLEDWRWLMDINLWGVVYGCHTFVPQMRAQRQGFILNVSSSAGLLSLPEMAPYNVAKAGVISLSETLSNELEKDNVAVTVLCPTYFQSDLHERTRTTNADHERIVQKLIRQASWSAHQIADVGLRGLEAKELYVLPQLDAQVLWRLKRTLGPSALQRLIRWYRNSRWLRDGASGFGKR